MLLSLGTSGHIHKGPIFNQAWYLVCGKSGDIFMSTRADLLCAHGVGSNSLFITIFQIFSRTKNIWGKNRVK